MSSNISDSNPPITFGVGYAPSPYAPLPGDVTLQANLIAASAAVYAAIRGLALFDSRSHYDENRTNAGRLQLLAIQPPLTLATILANNATPTKYNGQIDWVAALAQVNARIAILQNG
jgi:hypothetical protein